MKASENPYPSVLFDEQGSDIATPASDRWVVYTKSGGVYARNSAGTVVGPFGASAAGSLLAYKVHTAGDETTTSASLADMDATNAVVTFTAPDSLDVLVRMTGVCAPQQTAAAYVSMGLRESTSDIAGAVGESIVARAAAAATPEYRAYSIAFPLINISAGSHTYKASWATSAGTANHKANASAPFVMEVWALP